MTAAAARRPLRVTLVVAMARNRVIGRGGGLPWHLSGDLRHFKAITLGHPVVMGRRTYQSIGRALPGRRNIVVTRNPDFRAVGCETAASLDDALDLCRAVGDGEAMIIGGGEIYAQALAQADRIHLTEVHRDVDGDTRIPEIDPALWRESAREARPAETPDGPAYDFVTLDRRRG